MATDSSGERRFCAYGHERRPGASFCHTCHRINSKERYDSNPDAERKRKREASRRKRGWIGRDVTVPPRQLPKMPRRTKTPVPAPGEVPKKTRKSKASISETQGQTMTTVLTAGANIACPHPIKTETKPNKYYCYACGGEWEESQGTGVENNGPKRRGRKPKGTTQGVEVQSTPAGTQDHGHLSGFGVPGAVSGETLESDEADDVPGTPTASTISKGTKRTKKTAGEIATPPSSPEAVDPGPWHETQKCARPSCFAKLQHHGPNIVTTTSITYAYGCPNCDVIVNVMIGRI